MRKIITLLILTLIFISCGDKKSSIKPEKTKPAKEQIATNLKSVEVDIKGMTCEIGCARTIQSKLSKVDGVTYSKVNFDTKKGIFTYDANKLSKNDIVKKINGIAGGDIYKATKTTEIDSIIKKVN
ncbi:heavy metal-associated domain-containing protein [Lutibacter sp.]|uniref:heavy-metal-associated domain-containing protein n=1 Tax=Lutibacter sp. TaxID=1925666 RepID=UPI0025C669B5|nr:heavy metal-associated domain-containing protein [Lutibacter sp.]MCF6181206.1 cation transporter [Lutibacter sp.]